MANRLSRTDIRRIQDFYQKAMEKGLAQVAAELPGRERISGDRLPGAARKVFQATKYWEDGSLDMDRVVRAYRFSIPVDDRRVTTYAIENNDESWVSALVFDENGKRIGQL